MTSYFGANRPNFFIVGAPKCGTTSLYAYLAEHPEIFFPTVKEPQYFCMDFEKFRQWNKVDTPKRYANLYRQVPARCKVIGDASTLYLFSKVAIQNAYDFNPNARFIAMLRNPTEMAYSLHAHYIYRGRENVADFESAWRLQDLRARGENLPPNTLSTEHLQYRDMCRLGDQLERLFSIVPREQVKVLLIDDLKASPKELYEEVLQFLGLHSDGRELFPKLNESRTHRFGEWGRIVMRAPFPLNIVRHAMSPPVRQKIGKYVHRWFGQKASRTPMNEALRRELNDYFRDDVAKLEALISRDLHHWTNCENCESMLST